MTEVRMEWTKFRSVIDNVIEHLDEEHLYKTSYDDFVIKVRKGAKPDAFTVDFFCKAMKDHEKYVDKALGFEDEHDFSV